MNTPSIKQPTTPKPEIPAEIIASSIVAIADGMKALNATRLTRKAIIVLIHAHSNVGKRDVEIVLNNLEGLAATWLKPATAANAKK